MDRASIATLQYLIVKERNVILGRGAERFGLLFRRALGASLLVPQVVAQFQERSARDLTAGAPSAAEVAVGE